VTTTKVAVVGGGIGGMATGTTDWPFHAGAWIYEHDAARPAG
jgi:hypothetical protein